ncbi:MAG: hypothetical protein ABI175_16165 [Polyangiales bacterium]
MSSYAFTPGWGLPIVLVLALSAVSSLFGSGCALSTDTSGTAFAAEPAPEVCGGAVCFEATHTTVSHWGSGEVTLVAFRADDLGCEAPHATVFPRDEDHDGAQAKTTGGSFKSGRMIELKLHAPKQGATLPIVSHDSAAHAGEPCVTARALRVGPDGRTMASEETISGEATILELDPHSGRVLVKMDARWSSGVTSELRLEIEGPQACAVGG